MAKLFGTDGVRGIVGEGLTKELAYRLGEAAGHFLAGNKENAKIVIGRDTRGHGKMLEDAVVAGLNSVGVDALVCDVIPTPAIAYLVRKLEADGGVVISASHNPPEYNGIKLFSNDGFKLSDELEAEIEKVCLDPTVDLSSKVSKKGSSEIVENASDLYIDHTVGTVAGDLSGIKILIDCGHGAASGSTPEAFRRLGATITVINDQPNGTNINVDCGSTNLAKVSQLVKVGDYDLGIAHDGDADRVLAVDEAGNEIDGDYIMAILAVALKNSDKLANNTVVSTVMANLGFVKAMEANDIKLLQASVGDRYVLEQMRATGAVFGGEQSGHIIFLNYNTTGDGLVTALQLAKTVKDSGKKLSELAKVMQKYPQVMINVPVKNRDGLANNQNIRNSISENEKQLADNGRILVRPSGTESLIRVMAEAKDAETAHQVVENIVEVVKAELG